MVERVGIDAYTSIFYPQQRTRHALRHGVPLSYDPFPLPCALPFPFNGTEPI